MTEREPRGSGVGRRGWCLSRRRDDSHRPPFSQSLGGPPLVWLLSPSFPPPQTEAMIYLTAGWGVWLHGTRFPRASTTTLKVRICSRTSLDLPELQEGSQHHLPANRSLDSERLAETPGWTAQRSAIPEATKLLLISWDSRVGLCVHSQGGGDAEGRPPWTSASRQNDRETS